MKCTTIRFRDEAVKAKLTMKHRRRARHGINCDGGHYVMANVTVVKRSIWPLDILIIKHFQTT